jgi:hypothetical protein
MILTDEKRSTGKEPVPFPLSLPQIPYGLPSVWTRPFAGKCRRLTILIASSVSNRVVIIVCDDGRKDSYRNVVSL